MYCRWSYIAMVDSSRNDIHTNDGSVCMTMRRGSVSIFLALHQKGQPRQSPTDKEEQRRRELVGQMNTLDVDTRRNTDERLFLVHLYIDRLHEAIGISLILFAWLTIESIIRELSLVISWREQKTYSWRSSSRVLYPVFSYGHVGQTNEISLWARRVWTNEHDIGCLHWNDWQRTTLFTRIKADTRVGDNDVFTPRWISISIYVLFSSSSVFMTC